MAENKTKPNEADVEAYLKTATAGRRQEECFEVLEMMKEVTGLVPRMWGPSIVGFGKYHYKYESGREGDFFRLGFASRKAALTVYIMPGFKRYASLMDALGKFKTGSSCLYIKKLDDIDRKVLRSLMEDSFAYMNSKYPVEN